MDVSINDITDVEKEIQIQATADELQPHFEEAYKRYQKKVEIKGFRKGKAPLSLVKKVYGESIEYDSLDQVASEVYRKVVQDRDIHPIGEPVLTDIQYKRGDNLTFKIKYEIKPNFELKEYKGIPAEKTVHKVTDQEVEQEILRLRKSNHTLQEVQTAADDEHLVTADIQQLDSTGSPLIGKRTTDARLYLNDETIFPQIKEGLRNITVGESRRMHVTHEHGDHTHDDHLEISAKKIEKLNLPEFNDEFIQKITKNKVPTVNEFEKNLREDLERYWAERSERKLVDALIAEIVRRHQITVPESLVKGVQDSLLEEIKNRYPDKKLPADFNEETFRQENRGYAIFQATWYLLRERIIEAEHITVDEADLVRLAERDAPNVGIDKERLVEFYKSSSAVKDRLVSEKLIDFLKQHATITEKVTEEAFE